MSIHNLEENKFQNNNNDDDKNNNDDDNNEENTDQTQKVMKFKIRH